MSPSFGNNSAGQQYQQYNNPSFNTSTQSLSPFELLDLKEQRIRKKNEKLKMFFIVMITVVISVLIIGCFLAVLMKAMINTAKQETNETGNKLGGKLNQWVDNATNWIKQTFPPRRPGQPLVLKPPKTEVNDTGSITLFGEGRGFSLNGLVNVFGEVINAVNRTKELVEERQLLNAASSSTKPSNVYHLT